MESYCSLFEEVCQDIDRAILDFHGVKCYRDGNKDNNNKSNIYFLHVCDVLNCMSSKYMHQTLPEVGICTSTLIELPQVGVVNDLELKYLHNHLVEFLNLHLDYLYVCYAYYGNHSFMAIRTKIQKDNKIFKESLFFMNDDHFFKHQEGNLMEFNQNESRLESKIMYRSISNKNLYFFY